MRYLFFGLLISAAFSAALASPAQAKEVSVWYPGWGTSGISDYDMTKRNAASINEVNPYWYVLKPDGTIEAYPWAEEQRLIDLAREESIRVRPLITNDFDPARVQKVLSTPESREAHAQDIVDLVVAKGYQGVDVDYELLYAEDADEYVEFLRVLKEKLHAKNKRLSVAVMPKQHNKWHKGHDYSGIGKHADQVKIMAYDQHWDGSNAGPAATPEWIDSVLTYAETQIPPHKIRLGIPFYAREWVDTEAKDMVWRDARTIVNKYNPKIYTHPSGERYFRYTKDGIEREVWFQTVPSLDRKLEVLTEKHPRVGGISIWHIGGEYPGYWKPINNRLK